MRRIAATGATFLVRAAASSTLASLSCALALAGLASHEGKGALQPLNATSHWLKGPGAARRRTVDLAHTGVGLATHQAAMVFWATLFEAWIGPRRPLALKRLVADAAAMSAVAAGVDYLATPKRFTPGWEFVLSKRAMALAYLAMAAGLALGVHLVDRAEPRIDG